jgi:1-acyl-sn-glycerol-3-phosphate acyltransferase
MIRLIAKLYFGLIGWKTRYNLPPDLKKYVMIAAPHTSNWDFPICMAALSLMRVKVNYLAKKELFRFPLGPIMRFFGGIPVDRSRNTGMVDAMIAEFDKHNELVLMIPPEGTRGYVKEWKTGFYRVAVGAGVPIVLGYLDYGRKEAGLGKAFYPSGDYEKDLPLIQAFYRTMQAKHPERSSLR